MTKKEFLKELSNRFKDFTLWRDGIYKRNDYFIYGFQVEKIYQEIGVHFKIIPLISDIYISSGGDLPGLFLTPVKNKKSFPFLVSLKTESIPEDFFTAINEQFIDKINYDQGFCIKTMINFLEGIIKDNYYGNVYHVLEYEFLLYFLTFTKESVLKKVLMDNYINYLENIDLDIIKNHYYSDVESWRSRIRNCLIDNSFLKDNADYNEAHFNLKAINKEEINTTL